MSLYASLKSNKMDSYYPISYEKVLIQIAPFRISKLNIVLVCFDQRTLPVKLNRIDD